MYFLSQDNDCHWFIIPVENRNEWNAWLEEEGEDSWVVPSFAIEVGGRPSKVTFKDYIFN